MISNNPPSLLDSALGYVRAGISIIPVNPLTKQPHWELLPRGPDGKSSWKEFQLHPPDEQKVTVWVQAGARAFAAVCGKVSGGLEVIDFEFLRFFEAWCAEVGDLAKDLPVQRSGGGGYHAIYRRRVAASNAKLAWTPNAEEESGREIAIETRGEGGYVVLAPSPHASGNRYEVVRGELTRIPLISAAHADALLAAARKLDEAPKTRQEVEREAREDTRHRASLNGRSSVIDEFNRRRDIDAALLAHGYTSRGAGRYTRPGGRSASVTVAAGRSFHHSSNDPLCDGYWHRPFDLFCLFGHGGNCKGAVRAAASELGLSLPAPRSRRRLLDPYRPFPLDLLPAPVAKFIRQGARAMGCDPAYLALPLLAALASAVGNTRRIRLKFSWAEPAVLWTMVVADSGTLKSPAMERAMRPLYRRQKRILREYQRAKAEYEAQLKKWKARPKDERGEEPAKPPPCPHLFCSDVTVEALADRLEKTPRGILVAVDELAGWFGSFNQYKQGRGGDVTHYLTMHRAGLLKVDRKTGDKTTIYVPHAAVCVTGTIQPGTLRRVLTPEFFDNGMAARLLPAMPPRTPKRWTEADIDPAAELALDEVFEALFKLKPDKDVDGDPCPRDLELTDGAKEAWARFYNEHAEEQAELEGGPALATWSKLEGYAARLALVIHLVRCASGDDAADPERVDEQSIEAGIALARWFGHEARRVHAALGETDGERGVRELAELVREMGGRVTPRDLQQRRRKYRNNPVQAEADLDALAAAGLAQWEPTKPAQQGGRPSRVLVLTPSAQELAAPPAPTANTVNVNETRVPAPATGGFVDVDAVDGPAVDGAAQVHVKGEL